MKINLGDLLVLNILVFVLKNQKVLRISSQTSEPKISAAVDGGLSGGSSMHRPGSDDPHRHQRILRTLGQPLPILFHRANVDNINSMKKWHHKAA